MKKMQLWLIGLALSSFIFAGCGTTAHVQKDNTANFSQYKTYAWSSVDNRHDTKGYNNSITQQNVQLAVDKELKKQGWRLVKRNPDVLLNYDVLIERSTSTKNDPVYSNSFYRTFYNPYRNRFYSVYYPSQFLGYDNSTVAVKEGTITITMTDTQTDKTVWQGWTTNELDSRHLTEKEIQNSVKAIFKKFDVAKN